MNVSVACDGAGVQLEPRAERRDDLLGSELLLPLRQRGGHHGGRRAHEKPIFIVRPRAAPGRDRHLQENARLFPLKFLPSSLSLTLNGHT